MKDPGAASILLLLTATALSAVPAPAGPTPAPTAAFARTAVPLKAKAHGIALTGRISRVDPARKSFAVRDAAGRETALSWTAATKITGGELKVGEAVTLRYLDKDARHIATSVRVGAPGKPTATTPATTAPSPSS